MGKLTEIRWHGRGGQGAKTASQLLAEAASAAGMYVQGFPEYGPERMGAPVLAFNRLSDGPITLHCHVTEPDVIMVLDPSLIGRSVTAGLTDHAVVIVNTGKTPGEIRGQMGVTGGKIYTVDASRIAVETIGRDIPNTPLMGALIKVTAVVPYEQFMTIMHQQLEDKFKAKPSVIQGNLEAIERAYREVRGE
ncbi:MAG: 2-oxoacid:acceptor oxidoreductase family protein [Bacillota bacterium]|nr:2-oxoacid:acceptor oxidoreductase family protein [Bacillota bacterium]